MPPFEALKRAREQSLDLVEIAPTANPPVCRIMDYGKFLYQQSKRAHEAKKHQRSIVIKEIKFRPNVDEHDYQFKKNNAVRFLTQGDKDTAARHDIARKQAVTTGNSFAPQRGLRVSGFQRFARFRFWRSP